jgi:hypothetical protein
MPKTEINLALYFTFAGIQAFGSLMGLYGSLWIMVNYIRRKILNNSVGLTILAIGLSDFGYATYTFVQAVDLIFGIRNQMSVEFNEWYSYFMIVLARWSTVSSIHYNLTLAGQTLYILVGGSHTNLLTFKWLLFLAGIVGPVLYYFIPTALIHGKYIFDLRMSETLHANEDIVVLYALISIAFICNLLTYFMVYKRNTQYFREKSTVERYVSEKVVSLVFKLVKTYSIALAVAWVPWLVYNMIIRVLAKKSVIEYCDMLRWETPIIVINLLISPGRGYLHAYAVYQVYKQESGMGETRNGIVTFFRNAALLGNISSKNNQKTYVDPATPDWSFTFKSITSAQENI